MTETRLIDPIADPEWASFVENSPSAEIFHHPRWLELLRSQYGYELQACCAGNGRSIEAGIPIARVASRLTGRRFVSLPFSDVCSPVVTGNADPVALVALAKGLAQEAEQTGLGLTIHAFLPGIPGAFIQHRYLRHRLTLVENPAEVEQLWKSPIKRGVKKAEREGLAAERRTDRPALDAFYSLHLQTRQRLGAPTQPKRFIRRFEELFAAGLGFVEIVFDDRRPIAAAVFLTHGDTVTYKYGASDARSLGKRPNNLLFADVIRWACESGFHTLDFGRTDRVNDGLRSFKRSWGGRESDLPYTYVADHAPSPEPARRDRIVTKTIQRSPAVVSRLAGEALYRHFG